MPFIEKIVSELCELGRQGGVAALYLAFAKSITVPQPDAENHIDEPLVLAAGAKLYELEFDHDKCGYTESRINNDAGFYFEQNIDIEFAHRTGTLYQWLQKRADRRFVAIVYTHAGQWLVIGQAEASLQLKTTANFGKAFADSADNKMMLTGRTLAMSATMDSLNVTDPTNGWDSSNYTDFSLIPFVEKIGIELCELGRQGGVASLYLAFAKNITVPQPDAENHIDEALVLAAGAKLYEMEFDQDKCGYTESRINNDAGFYFEQNIDIEFAHRTGTLYTWLQKLADRRFVAVAHTHAGQWLLIGRPEASLQLKTTADFGKAFADSADNKMMLTGRTLAMSATMDGLNVTDLITTGVWLWEDGDPILFEDETEIELETT